MRAPWAILLVAAASPAMAHGDASHGPGLDLSWSLNPAVVLPLGLTGLLYAVGTARVWGRAGAGRGIRSWQFACFWLGWLSLALALVSPLHRLGERLFAAHMVEHEILMTISAPLLVLARPGGAYLWGLPPAWRRALGGVARHGSWIALWRGLTDPTVATVLHGIAIWAWHAPALFEAALSHEAVHWLQHLSFFVTALFFWWALLYGRARERGYGAAVFYLFATGLHSGFLGILLTISRRPWYPADAAFTSGWGLTPLEDQQLAGVIMWVPGGFAYVIAALVLAAIWIQGSGASVKGETHVQPVQ